MTKFSTEALARACARRPWTIVGMWLAVLAASVVAIATLLGSALTTDSEVTANTESNRAYEVIHAEFGPRSGSFREESEVPEELVIVRSGALLAADDAFARRVRSLVGELDRIPGVALVERPTTGTGTASGADSAGAGASRDGHAVLLTVRLRSEDAVEDVLPVIERADGVDGFDVETYGTASVDKDFEELSQHDLKTGELYFGAPAALVILFLVFGTIVAGVVPLLLALVGITVALGLTAVLGESYTFSLFVTNMISGVGLALGVDYGLFVLSRFREERARGLEKLAAIEAAGATASRAVLFSGVAVAVGLLGMVLVPDSILRSLGAGAILVTISSVAVATTLLPAVLSLLGDRVNSLRLPFFARAAHAEGGAEGRFWAGVARVVMRRPAFSLALPTAFLLACAAPLLDLETGQSGVSTLPDRLPSKQGLIALQRSFPEYGRSPALVVVRGGDVDAAVDELQTALDADPAFAPGRVATRTDTATLVEIPLAGDPFGDESDRAVTHLREDVVPALGGRSEYLVAGATAEELDYVALTNRYLPIVFGFVLTLSFILLTVAFRSLVLPLKAILLNLLSVGAAYGLLVLVFQKGVGADLLGVQQVDHIEAWVPLFLFSLLFGLSMDYHVFLLSRIRERYLATCDNAEAVAFGVSSTARIITGAALIIVAVFVGFAMGDMVMFQHMGFGVAVALLLDATVIRSIVVPASMKLLGRWNWYLPRWLEWLPTIHVGEGRSGAPGPPAVAGR